MLKFPLAFISIILAFNIQGQDTVQARKSLIGWNTVSVLLEGVNLFGQTQVYKIFHLGMEAGYQFGPGGSYKLLDDNYHSHRLRGAFFKINPLFIFPRKHFQLNVGPVYIGSFYDESAVYELGNEKHLSTAKGFAHGVALHISADIPLSTYWGIRIGVQQGYSFRNDYARASALTYEPGLGAEMMGPHHQGFLGVFRRF